MSVAARARAFAAAFVACAACGGETGTITVELATAPGSDLLSRIQRLRLTLTEPRKVVEAERGPAGLALALEVEASGGAGAVIVEGFDQGGGLIAAGQSPPFAVAALNAAIVVYVATPLSIEPAPVALASAASRVASVPISFGVVIAGGATAGGVASDAMSIYNAYDHSLTAGRALIAPRIAPVLATGANNIVYILGGEDANGARGTVWRFDTNTPPNGAYSELTEHPELARAGEVALSVGRDRFVIAGQPPALLSFGTAAAINSGPAVVTGAGATVIVDSIPYAVFAGPPIVRFALDRFEVVTAADTPADAAAFALADGIVGIAGDRRELVLVDAVTGGVTRRADALSTARKSPAAAATARHVVVAGGFDPQTGTPLASADVFDAGTLELLATVPCAARGGHQAHALANGQILFVGGSTESATIELFTPPAELSERSESQP
jgi:hypothetical protein